MPEIACPTIQQVHYPLRHHPTNPKQVKDHSPHLIRYRTVKEEMIYRFSTPFAHKTPLKDNKMPLSKVVYSKDLAQSYSPREKSYSRRNLRLPHHFPRERNASRRGNRMIIPTHLETSTASWLPTKIVRTNTLHLCGIDQNHKRIQRLYLKLLVCKWMVWFQC